MSSGDLRLQLPTEKRRLLARASVAPELNLRLQTVGCIRFCERHGSSVQSQMINELRRWVVVNPHLG